MEEIIKNHIEKHIEAVSNFSQNLPNIEEIAEICIRALKNGNKLLIAGNGGSAADANHFAGELVGRFKKERKALPALALNNNSSVITAIGNDYAFDYVFSRQIEALAKPGDVFFAISTSGNSKNILEAIKVSKNHGCKVVGLTGKTGGKMFQECDFLINVPSEDTPRIQEMHELVIHILSELIENAFA
ncbi:MAG: D-sedoheptulose 7-phosphate isomerase [Candidatus Staskawiczbacteria bacterium]|nr:D-sedoheptulose 7-phosphate isomerase [Candidatus Staskawiczbacteria bacterium]